jgi:hypothetical protein
MQPFMVEVVCLTPQRSWTNDAWGRGQRFGLGLALAGEGDKSGNSRRRYFKEGGGR